MLYGPDSPRSPRGSTAWGAAQFYRLLDEEERAAARERPFANDERSTLRPGAMASLGPSARAGGGRFLAFAPPHEPNVVPVFDPGTTQPDFDLLTSRSPGRVSSVVAAYIQIAITLTYLLTRTATTREEWEALQRKREAAEFAYRRLTHMMAAEFSREELESIRDDSGVDFDLIDRTLRAPEAAPTAGEESRPAPEREQGWARTRHGFRFSPGTCPKMTTIAKGDGVKSCLDAVGGSRIGPDMDARNGPAIGSAFVAGMAEPPTPANPTSGVRKTWSAGTILIDSRQSPLFSAPCPMTEPDPPDDADDAYRAQLSVLLRKQQLLKAIAFLRSEVAGQPDPWTQFSRMGDLATVLDMSGQLSEAVAVMRDRAAFMPDESLSWTGLARHLLYCVLSADDESSKKALTEEVLRTAEHAAAVAERAGGTGLRNSLADRARFARRLGRWDLVEDSIRRILAIPDDRDVPDAPVEIDFLRDLPAGAVDPDLVERLRRKHAVGPERRSSRRD